MMNFNLVAYMVLERLAIDADGLDDGFASVCRDQLDTFWDRLSDDERVKLQARRSTNIDEINPIQTSRIVEMLVGTNSLDEGDAHQAIQMERAALSAALAEVREAWALVTWGIVGMCTSTRSYGWCSPEVLLRLGRILASTSSPAEHGERVLREAEERGYKRGLLDEMAAWEAGEKEERDRAVRCCQEADKIREDMSLHPVERARRVLMSRCDRYEYIPNYLAAVKDIDALIKAVQDEACRAFNGVAGKDPF